MVDVQYYRVIIWIFCYQENLISTEEYEEQTGDVSAFL